MIIACTDKDTFMEIDTKNMDPIIFAQLFGHMDLKPVTTKSFNNAAKQLGPDVSNINFLRYLAQNQDGLRTNKH